MIETEPNSVPLINESTVHFLAAVLQGDHNLSPAAAENAASALVNERLDTGRFQAAVIKSLCNSGITTAEAAHAAQAQMPVIMEQAGLADELQMVLVLTTPKMEF